MKQSGRVALYEDWKDQNLRDGDQEIDLKEFEKILELATAVELATEVDCDELISAASDLQRAAWLHGFNYAVKFLMNQ